MTERTRRHNLQSLGAPLSFWDFVVLITPFMSGLYLDTSIGNIYFQYLLLFAYLLRHIIIHQNLALPKFAQVALFFVFFISLLGNFIFLISPKYLFTFFPPIFLTYFAYGAFIISYNYDVDVIANKYFKISVLMCIFASLQQLLHFIGNDTLMFTAQIIKSNGSFIGVVGFSSEPSNFAVVLMPAVYIALHSIMILRKLTLSALLVIFTQVMTFSALGYLGIFISLCVMVPIVLRRSFLLFILASPVIIYLVSFLIGQEHFSRRLFDTLSVVFGSQSLVPYEVNLSTYSLLVNFNIVKTAVYDNYLLGSGVGTYSVLFNEYIGNYVIPSYRDSLPGQGTATSFLLKVTAEFGIVGTFFAIYFLFWGVDKSRDNFVNHAFLATLMVIYLRMGMYYINGIPLFIMMFALSKNQITSTRLRLPYLKQSAFN